MKIRNIQFRTTVLENNSRYHSVYLEPHEIMNTVNSILIAYSNSKSVQELISELQSAKSHDISNPKYIGIDEVYIYASKDKAVFDTELVTELKPDEMEINDLIEVLELYKQYLKRYENNQIPGLQPEKNLKGIEWDYISGWEREGRLEPKHIIRWAYVNNGYFTEQDEELMMYRPELIGTMHELMIDQYSKRRLDLLKTLKCYANHIYKKVNDANAKIEFKKLKEINSTDKKHLELIEFISNLEKEV